MCLSPTVLLVIGCIIGVIFLEEGAVLLLRHGLQEIVVVLVFLFLFHLTLGT
jgi:hypothetical protein